MGIESLLALPESLPNLRCTDIPDEALPALYAEAATKEKITTMLTHHTPSSRGAL